MRRFYTTRGKVGIMAMQENPWGTLIAQKVKSLGITAGTPITDAQLESVWQKMAEATKEHLSANMDVDLQAGDIPVPATGIKDSLSAPCTGAASSGAKTLTQRIK